MSTPSLHKVPSEQVPMPLLLEADPSPSVIARYLQDGHCVVARLDDAVVGIEQQQIARLDRGKMLPARIEQELAPIRRDRCAEMIADRLAPAEAMAKPEGSGKILTQRGQRRIVEHIVSGSRDVHALNRPSVVSAR